MHDTPLLVGLTGHRDLTDSSARQAYESLSGFFSLLREKLPHTTVRLMTGLADGADRLAARAALDTGCSVQAVLPMPVDLYEKDFTADSLHAFRQLLSREEVEVVEMSLPLDMTTEQAAIQGASRDRLYGRLGDYLIERSSILVALWDGKDNNLLGGTSDVVLRYLKAGGAGYSDGSEIRFLDKGEDGFQGSEFVYWIPVTRESGGEQPVSVGARSCYLSGNLGRGKLARRLEIPEELTEQLVHLDAYNSQYKDLVESGKFFTWGGLLEMLPNKESHHQLPVLEAIDAEYQKADGLALFNQKYSDRQFKLFGYMAALMGLLFLLYAKIIALKIFLIGYLALFIVGFVMHRQTARKQWFTNHLLQRVIAETLRTRFYLIIAGIDKRVDTDKLLDLFGINQFSGFSWIRHIFRSQQSLVSEHRGADEQENDVDFVCTAWLEDQAEYFKSKIEKLSHHHHRLEKIKGSLLLASVVAVVLLILFKKLLVGTTLIGALDLKTLVVFLMGLLPFWLGVWEIYQSKMAIKELLWQYRNQSNLFNHMSTRIKYSRSIDEKRRILAELGERSLTENYLWTIHRYHREHEPPTAG